MNLKAHRSLVMQENELLLVKKLLFSEITSSRTFIIQYVFNFVKPLKSPEPIYLKAQASGS